MPCPACLKISPSRLKEPCVRVQLMTLNLHRRGSTLNNHLQEWTETKRLRQHNLPPNFQNEPDSRVVRVTQDLGVTFAVTVLRFDADPQDVTAWKWKADSIPRLMDMPPYYISNMTEASQNMQQAVRKGKEEYINGLLAAANPISKKTFEAAFRYLETSKSALVSNALEFWVATRFIERPWRICEGNLPGFDPPNEIGCPWSGIVPVTPVMDTQIDHIAISYLLIPLGQRILQELDEKIRNLKRGNWFEIYLTIFIMMNNFEFVFADVIDYTTRHGLKSSKNGGDSLSQSYYHACQTMLIYFRFACNGQAPLSLTRKKENTPVQGLSFDQHEYLQDIKHEIDRQKPNLEDSKSGSVYRTQMYLCYKVVSNDWSPDLPHSEPIDNFTEQDFLTS
ncbi:uncharacterized protein BCR38DRAFT_336593 [Pseudomassariella vexata]|uniref:Uncharacterized protein n=1 Tax=Pseudomassariella vexata TaxID=1141098 RepID=A0A1Y2E6F9_9PEZI|nr:uncharacterized protein BCR38DRAFT_336593 [Pseudomassariella vexata]ORY67027.1 hypothetical protein BCR38DRAFT_336593 [Pseudomassariella vexata]